MFSAHRSLLQVVAERRERYFPFYHIGMMLEYVQVKHNIAFNAVNSLTISTKAAKERQKAKAKYYSQMRKGVKAMITQKCRQVQFLTMGK